jgi:hypothetical protein
VTSRGQRVVPDKNFRRLSAPWSECRALTMDHDDYATDPFSSEGLWRISQFTLQSLQPLDPVPWDEGLPGMHPVLFSTTRLLTVNAI